MAAVTRLALALLFLGGTACTPSLDWFLTPDQQGRLWLERGEPLRAARSFEDRLWKGLAYYGAEDFASAAAALAPLDTARGKFQYGNALARQERLPEAVAAYQRALALEPEFPEAVFNLDWVRGLLELDQMEYEDAGGTGGKLEADKIVFDEKGAKGKGEMTTGEARAQGLSEAQLREMWMRRVQTAPADFLRLKFLYQDQTGSAP
jgi:Ca-activated chloride channel family protein